MPDMDEFAAWDVPETSIQTVAVSLVIAHVVSLHCAIAILTERPFSLFEVVDLG